MPLDTAPLHRSSESLALRPVTHEDQAHFACGRLLKDGSPNPDYGKVFWTPTANGATAYYFDRKGNDFACWMMGGDREGELIVQGRSFRIAGHVEGLFS